MYTGTVIFPVSYIMPDQISMHVVGKMGIFESIYTLHTVNPEILVVHDLNLAI